MHRQDATQRHSGGRGDGDSTGSHTTPYDSAPERRHSFGSAGSRHAGGGTRSVTGDGADVSAWRLEEMGVVVDGDVVAPLHVLYDAASGQLYDLDGAVAVEAFDAASYPIAWTRAVLTAWDAS